jgi:hypothetical protein
MEGNTVTRYSMIWPAYMGSSPPRTKVKWRSGGVISFKLRGVAKKVHTVSRSAGMSCWVSRR